MSNDAIPVRPNGKKRDSLRVTIRKEVWPVCILIGVLTVYVVYLVVGLQITPIRQDLAAIRVELQAIASRPIQLQQQQTTHFDGAGPTSYQDAITKIVSFRKTEGQRSGMPRLSGYQRRD